MLINQITKKIQIPFLNQLSFGFIKQTKILLLKTNNTIKYFLIPEEVSCNTDKTNLILTIKSTEKKDLIKLEETEAPLLLMKKSVFLVKKTEETVFVIKINTAKAPKYATWR